MNWPVVVLGVINNVFMMVLLYASHSPWWMWVAVWLYATICTGLWRNQ